MVVPCYCIKQDSENLAGFFSLREAHLFFSSCLVTKTQTSTQIYNFSCIPWSGYRTDLSCDGQGCLCGVIPAHLTGIPTMGWASSFQMNSGVSAPVEHQKLLTYLIPSDKREATLPAEKPAGKAHRITL